MNYRLFVAICLPVHVWSKGASRHLQHHESDTRGIEDHACKLWSLIGLEALMPPVYRHAHNQQYFGNVSGLRILVGIGLVGIMKRSDSIGTVGLLDFVSGSGLRMPMAKSSRKASAKKKCSTP